MGPNAPKYVIHEYYPTRDCVCLAIDVNLSYDVGDVFHDYHTTDVSFVRNAHSVDKSPYFD